MGLRRNMSAVSLLDRWRIALHIKAINNVLLYSTFYGRPCNFRRGLIKLYLVSCKRRDLRRRNKKKPCSRRLQGPMPTELNESQRSKPLSDSHDLVPECAFRK